MTILLLCILQALPLPAAQTVGDDGLPYRGIVYELDPNPGTALDDLVRIRSTGANAVLTGLVRDARLLALADSIGLHLFQQVPLRELPAAHLVSAVRSVTRTLDEALDLSRTHASARHFGLVWNSDTSEPAACDAIADLAATARSVGRPDIEVFYTSRFVESDRCADLVDFVLLDTDAAEDPTNRLARWRGAHQVPVGLAALGNWVMAGIDPGYKVPHSPENQARYLEEHLGRALSGRYGTLRAVFVRRWRDIAAERLEFAGDATKQGVQPFGLIAADGSTRPSYEVVRGLYTGGQGVFAFPAGSPTAELRPVWYRWLGWGVIFSLALLFRVSLTMGTNARRYFFAHGFYLETVASGRQVESGTHLLVLVVLSASVAVLAGITVDALAPLHAFGLIAGRLSAPTREAVVQLIDQPWLLFVSAAGLYGLFMLGWGLLLTILSGFRRRLNVAQRLALVVWPRWPTLLIMVGALVADTLPAEYRLKAVVGLVMLWALSALWSTLRMVEDFARVARTSRLPAYLLGILVPLLLLTAVGTLLVKSSTIPVLEFAWHLTTRA